MDKSELREKVIEAMLSAYWEKWSEGDGCGSSATARDCMTAVLDALHGIVRVNPPEATEEMIKAGHNFGYYAVMAAAGDITQPKGTKSSMLNKQEAKRKMEELLAKQLERPSLRPNPKDTP